MKNSLLLRLYRLKHASHDQSTHGRRGSGGGSSAGARGKKPKAPPAISSSQSFFTGAVTSFNTPQSTTEPRPIADFMQKPLADIIAKIDASSLPEEKKAKLREIATKAAEASSAIHARRDELYTGSIHKHDVRYQMFEESYDMTKPVVDAAHAAATEFQDEIRREIAGDFLANTPEDRAKLVNAQLNAQRVEYDALLVESARLTIRQRDPAQLAFQNELTGDSTMPFSVAVAVSTINDHLHIEGYDASMIQIAPVDDPNGVYDIKPFIAESHYDPNANVVAIGLYASGGTEYDVNTGETKFVNEVPATPGSVAAVTSHEIGHWIENNKHMRAMSASIPGGIQVDSTTLTLRKLWGDDPAIVSQIDKAANGSNYKKIIEGTGRAIPYANQIFGLGRKDGTDGYSGSEALSTTLEFLFGAEIGVREEDSRMRSLVLTDKRVMQYTFGMMSY